MAHFRYSHFAIERGSQPGFRIRAPQLVGQPYQSLFYFRTEHDLDHGERLRGCTSCRVCHYEWQPSVFFDW